MREKRLLRISAAAMGFGFLFLLAACGLLAWHYIVSPVSQTVAILVAAAGIVAATAILVAVFLFYLSERQGKPKE